MPGTSSGNLNLKEQITEFVNAHLEADEFLVAVELKGSGTRQKVQVLLDGDEGISIDACSRISRQLGNYLEENNLIEDAYTLEVSSPGVDYPLSSERQFRRHIGRRLKLTMANGSTKTVVLNGVENGVLSVDEETTPKGKKIVLVPTQVALADITKTQIILSFK
jgi:ribosome maturation factor RimP